jgi:putative chitobiose transport system substrate-binding protein
MKKLIYLLVFGALAGIALLISGGCGDSSSRQKADGVKELTFLTMQLNPPFGEFFEGLFKEFEAQHPGVKIKWLDQPYQGYETKLMTSLMGRKGPDVINLATETVPKYAGSGHLADLEALLPPEVISSYIPKVMESGCQVKGKTYAVPWYMSMDIVLYNRKIFADAGIDLTEPIRYLDDIPELCRVIKEKTGHFAFFPLYTEGGSLRWYLIEAGVPLVDETRTKAVFNTPKGVEILTFWTDLYKNKLVPSEALTAMHRRPTELFNSGRLAILTTGAEFIRNVKSDAPDIYNNLMIGPRLTWKGQKFQPVAVHVLTVNKNASDPKLAAEFAAFITNAQNQVAFCKRATIFPSILAGLDDPFFTDADDTLEGQIRRICAEKARDAFLLYPLKDMGKLQNVFNSIMEKTALGKLTPEQALQQAETQWNEILRP